MNNVKVRKIAVQNQHILTATVCFKNGECIAIFITSSSVTFVDSVVVCNGAF